MEPLALIYHLALALLVLSGVVLSGWMAFWVGRNLLLSIKRRRPWPLIAAWMLGLVPPTAIFAGTGYVVWFAATRLSQGIGPP
jgi:hypothetical protein